MSVLPNVAASLAPRRPLPRLGQISFVNCLPVVLPIQRGQVALPAEVLFASPAQLNAAYAAGGLDVGAMSSFFYLEQADMHLVPRLSIAADGPVGSVLFFSKVSPSSLSGAKVAVPACSATSVNLLQVLLREEFDVRANLVVEPEPDLSGDRYAAALVIGDRALAVDGGWSKSYHRLDMGHWWRERTGLPMVFGVWAARAGWAEGNAGQFQSICVALRSSADLGLSALLPEVVSEAARRTGLERQRLEDYFRRQLNFELTSRHADGLNLFGELCRHYGLLTKAPGGRT